jgi:hypothetical protein
MHANPRHYLPPSRSLVSGAVFVRSFKKIHVVDVQHAAHVDYARHACETYRRTQCIDANACLLQMNVVVSRLQS